MSLASPRGRIEFLSELGRGPDGRCQSLSGRSTLLRTLIIAFDRVLSRLSRARLLGVCLASVVVIALVDFLTGYEISMSLFYLAPVATAAWYAGKRPGITLAVLSSLSWFVADIAAGNHYSHWSVPIWNASIRLGFFLANGILMAMLRRALLDQQQRASTDALTGIFNRGGFRERLRHDLQIAQRNGKPLTLALLDLDNFKILNDTHGHASGDQALTAVARALRRVTRAMDTVARLGGDEFVLVLPETDETGAREVIYRLRQEVTSALENVAPGVTCSIGVLTFRKIPATVEAAVGAADGLMYQAKRRGKNTVTYGSEDGQSPGAALTRDISGHATTLKTG